MATAQERVLTSESEVEAPDTPAHEDAIALEPPPRNMPRRKKKLLVAAAIVAGCLLLGLGARYLVWSAHHEETDDAYLAGHVHPISARITDNVQQVLIDDNQHVSAGQTLVVLDPSDFRVRLQEAQAALDAASQKAGAAAAAVATTSESARAQTTQARGSIGEAQASIAAAKAAVVAAQNEVPRAKAQLQEAHATLLKERQDLKRYQDLYAKDQVSRQTLDHTQASYQVAVAAQAAAEDQIGEANANLAAAKQGVVHAESLFTHSKGGLESASATRLNVHVRQEQYKTAEAAVQQALAALRNAELQLSYTVIKAPVSGRIGKKSVEVGQRVQVGQPLMAIVEDKLWVIANFKETQLTKMRPGQAVDIDIDAFPGHTFHGHVDSIAPGSGNEFALLPPDNATGNFTKIVQRIPVKIVFDAASVRGYEGLLSPGMSSVVTVTTR